MSGNSKKTEKNSKSQQDLGQKVTEEWNKFTKNIPDFKKEIEDIINSGGAEKDNMMKRARDKMVEFYQESKKHSQVVLFGVIFGSLVVSSPPRSSFWSSAYGVMKMIS